MSLQVEVALDRSAEATDGMGQRRHADARCELGRVRGPADALATLQDERSKAATREIRRADEGVMARADEDCVPRPGRAATRHARRRPGTRRRLARSSSAAMRPFAPMIPPPGWVDEPHSHKSRTGVRKRAQ